MAKLTAAQLKALPDSMFGLPKTRQYPMPDKAHVIKAIQFFKFCKDSDKPELAKNINRRAKELKMQIKVQPSSAFYKYADKSILKEAVLIQEFHIGQLSPIVTLQPEVLRMSFGNGKREDSDGPLERLNKIWGSNMSLDEKKESTATIVTGAIKEGCEVNAQMLAILEGIDDMAYMQSSWTPDEENTPNLASRLYDRNNEFYMIIQDAIREHRLDDILKIMKSMTPGTMFACTVALVKYTTELTNNEKRFILDRIPKMPEPIKLINLFNVFTDNNDPNLVHKDNENVVKNMTDEDIYAINGFINMITDVRKLWIIERIACRNFNANKTDIFVGITGDLAEGNTDSLGVRMQLEIFRLMETNPSIGYYRKTLENGFLNFIRIGRRIYTVSYVYSETRYHLHLICVIDYDNPEYNQNMVSFIMGSDIKFKIITRTITMPEREHPSLEASDFASVYKGIQINTNGNVSFMIDELQPWDDKLAICKKMMERNLKDKEYENYKNNLCALYSLINIIYNKYNPTLMDDSAEAKAGIHTMDKATTLFRNGIEQMNKIQPEFNFIDYYLSQHYNDKLEVFTSMDDKELRDEATIAYRWIING